MEEEVLDKETIHNAKQQLNEKGHLEHHTKHRDNMRNRLWSY